MKNPASKKDVKSAVKSHEKRMHGLKCGGRVKKYAEGGKTTAKPKDKELGSPTPDQQEEMRGKVQDLRNQKAWEEYQKRKQGVKKASGGAVKKYAKGGGVERKGKTKGRII